MSAPRFAFLLALVPFWLGALRPVSGVEVTIRVIDARNGKPYAYLGILLTLLKLRVDPGKSTPGFETENVLAYRRAVTDFEGKVTIDVTPPFPQEPEVKRGKYTVEVRPRSPHYGLPEQLALLVGDGRLGCGTAFFDMNEVLTKGVVGTNECRTKFAKKKVKFEAKPGEIIYFAAPLSFWERVFWP